MYTIEFPQADNENFGAYLERFEEWLSSLKGNYFSAVELAVTLIKNMNAPTRTYFESICGDLSTKSGDEALELLHWLANESFKPNFSISLDVETTTNENIDEVIESCCDGLEESKPYKECEESEIATIMHEDCEENVTYDKEERMMDNFENPFFEESWDIEGEDRLVENLEIKWDVNDDLFEECLVDDSLNEINLSTPCIWDDYPTSLDTHLFYPLIVPYEPLSIDVEEEEHIVDCINEEIIVKDILWDVDLDSSMSMHFSFKHVDLAASFPLLYPPTCLSSSLLCDHNSLEVVDVLSSQTISYYLDINRIWEPPFVLFKMSFNKPPSAIERGNLFVPLESCNRTGNNSKRSLTFVLFAYTLSCCYLCFCIAHAQGFDRLLRALSCFDLSICAK